MNNVALFWAIDVSVGFPPWVAMSPQAQSCYGSHTSQDSIHWLRDLVVIKKQLISRIEWMNFLLQELKFNTKNYSKNEPVASRVVEILVHENSFSRWQGHNWIILAFSKGVIVAITISWS